MNGKSGQVTIYVIIALVLLIIIGIVIYLNARVNSAIPDEPLMTAVPEEFKPIRTYVESCMKQIAEDGVRKLANHGGYIDPLDEDYTLANLIYDPTNPTESELVSVGSSRDALIVPYWYFLDGKNTCTNCGVSSLAPTVEFMELQLSFYIEENIDDCLAGFSSLKETGFDIINISNPIVDANIYDEGQDFLLTYTLQASKEGATQEISDYYVRSSLPLKRLYDIAYNVTYYESMTNHLDTFTKYLISSQSGPSMDRLPPLSYTNNDKFMMFWLAPVVENKLKNILFAYTQALQVMGTKNFDDSFINKISDNLTMEKTLYFQGILPIYDHDSETNKDISVGINYINSPIYVEVWPHEGSKIGPKYYSMDPSGISTFLPEPHYNSYNFFYDVSYPLIVEVKNYDYSNTNNELNFMFALEVNIRKNQVMNEILSGNGPTHWDTNYINMRIIDTDTTEPDVDPSIIVGDKTSENIFCELSQQVSGNISFLLFDRNNGIALDDAIISYGCGNYEECTIGKTELNLGAGYFNGKMPLCMNGYVLIEKVGYQSKRIKLTTEKDKNINLGAIGLYPFVTKKVIVKKYSINYDFESNSGKLKIDGTSIASSNSELLSTESAIVKLSLVGEDIDLSHDVFLTLNGNETGEIQLVPGRYSIDISYMNEEGIVVPEKCDRACEKCQWYETCSVKKCKYFPADPLEIKPALWGGVDFNSSKPIFLRARDVYNNDNVLELYTFVYPKPNEVSCLNSLEEMSKKTSYTMDYRSILVPRFVSDVTSIQ
jgi:hypothetical protein